MKIFINTNTRAIATQVKPQPFGESRDLEHPGDPGGGRGGPGGGGGGGGDRSGGWRGTHAFASSRENFLGSFLVESKSLSLSMAIFLVFLFLEWKNSSPKNCFHKRAADGTRERVPH